MKTGTCVQLVSMCLRPSNPARSTGSGFTCRGFACQTLQQGACCKLDKKLLGCQEAPAVLLVHPILRSADALEAEGASPRGVSTFPVMRMF